MKDDIYFYWTTGWFISININEKRTDGEDYKDKCCEGDLEFKL